MPWCEKNRSTGDEVERPLSVKCLLLMSQKSVCSLTLPWRKRGVSEPDLSGLRSGRWCTRISANRDNEAKNHGESVAK